MPIGIIGIILVSRFIQNVHGEAWPLDVRGFLLSGTGLGLLIFGMTLAGRGIVRGNIVLALIVAGAVLLGLLLSPRAQSEIPDPRSRASSRCRPFARP